MSSEAAPSSAAGAGSVPTPSGTSAPTPTSSGSGFKVNAGEAVLAEFKALRTRRKYRYIIFKIEEETLELVVEKTGPPTSTARDLINSLPISQPRYACYDLDYTTKDGRKASKLFFIVWTPAVGRSGLLYASQRRNLDAVISGVEDAQVGSKEALAKLIEPSNGKDDEEEDEWDPDA